MISTNCDVCMICTICACLCVGERGHVYVTLCVPVCVVHGCLLFSRSVIHSHAGQNY